MSEVQDAQLTEQWISALERLAEELVPVLSITPRPAATWAGRLVDVHRRLSRLKPVPLMPNTQSATNPYGCRPFNAQDEIALIKRRLEELEARVTPSIVTET